MADLPDDIDEIPATPSTAKPNQKPSAVGGAEAPHKAAVGSARETQKPSAIGRTSSPDPDDRKQNQKPAVGSGGNEVGGQEERGQGSGGNKGSGQGSGGQEGGGGGQGGGGQGGGDHGGGGGQSGQGGQEGGYGSHDGENHGAGGYNGGHQNHDDHKYNGDHGGYDGMHHDHAGDFGHPYSSHNDSDGDGSSYGKDHGYGTDGHGERDHEHGQDPDRMNSDMFSDSKSDGNEPESHANNMAPAGWTSQIIQSSLEAFPGSSQSDITNILSGAFGSGIDSTRTFSIFKDENVFDTDLAGVADGSIISQGSVSHQGHDLAFEGLSTTADLSKLPNQLTDASENAGHNIHGDGGGKSTQQQSGRGG